MLELKNDSMVFSFPEVHPDASITISLIRTFRIPDDGKKYPLPPGLGTFPARHVDDFKSRVPEKWVKHGGVLIPMYQSEAMWLHFKCNYSSSRGHAYPFAVRVATGKTSAVTGKKWTKDIKPDDYLITPEQPWLDGYVVADGVIRQFVAAPLGQGFTAEEQITGKAEFGGLQIEVLPMKGELFERRWPKLPPRPMPIRSHHDGYYGGGSGWIGGGKIGSSGLPGVYTNILTEIGESEVLYSSCVNTESLHLPDSVRSESINSISELGLAPGGTMSQQIFKDPYGIDEWVKNTKSRCFIHLLNSMIWRSVTGSEPPTVPFTAEDYSRRGMPWFDRYRDDLKTASGTEKTQNLKGIAELEKQKGVQILPENQSVTPNHVVKIKKKLGEVRDGVWK